MPRPVRHRSRSGLPSPRSLRAVLGGALLLVALTAPSALAKEIVEMTLAAPLPADAEPGSTVTAVFTVTAATDTGSRPLRGSPVFIRLFGPTGAMTQAEGIEGRIPGTYRAAIEIPAGGAKRAEFGIHGSTIDASGNAVPSDIIRPFHGILVAAGVPPAVNPDRFRLPDAKTRPDPAAGAAGQPAPHRAGPADAGQSSPPTSSGTGPDGRAVLLASLAGIASIVAGIGLGRRRRIGRPAT